LSSHVKSLQQPYWHIGRIIEIRLLYPGQIINSIQWNTDSIFLYWTAIKTWDLNPIEKESHFSTKLLSGLRFTNLNHCYLCLWLALLEEKSVTVELGESQPCRSLSNKV
jgi:hypothetical protein